MRSSDNHLKASIVNPYASDVMTDDLFSAPVRRADASIFWFVGIAFVPFFSRMFSNDTNHILQIGVPSTIIETLLDVLPPVLVASVLFLIARALLCANVSYASTRGSLMLTGLLASGYLFWLDYCSWYNSLRFLGIDRDSIWWVGSAVGVVASVGLVAIDRWVGTPVGIDEP